MKILFIGHSYHQSTGSSKFFISLIEKMGPVDFLWDEEWLSPNKKISLNNINEYNLVIVWQLPHIARSISESAKSKTIYVPMHDAVSGIGARFWRKLRGMRVVCFSYATYIACKNNKVEAFFIQYYPQPKETSKNFSKLKLFFWQRQRTPNWRSICGDIPVAQFDGIHLHTAIDPGNEPFISPLPCEVNKYNITTSAWFADKDAFLRVLEDCNVFYAPRREEGIGMALLEAMQRGMVCIANNQPTMSEYIVHGMNGFLTPTAPTEPIVIKDEISISSRALNSISSGYRRYLKRSDDLINFLIKKPSRKYRNLLSPLKEKIAQRKQNLLPSIQEVKNLQPKINKSNPKLTVITVVRNDVNGLLRTINSVADQTYNDFEYIIIDGQSTDRTRSILKKIPAGFAICVSEPDDGPYDAMNKGAKMASGEYVLFLNAGDTLFCNRTLEFCMDDDHRGADIIYGHHIYTPEGKASAVHKAEWLPRTIESLKNGQLSYSWLSGIPCHQSTITRTDLLRKRPYDTAKYKIAADHDFLFSCLLNGATSHHANIVISNYFGGGMSSKNIKKCVSEWKQIAENHSDNPTGVVSFYEKGRFW